MKKMNLEWSGHGFSCLWSREHGFLHYHPRHDVEQIHELYGGENYYRSMSGRTGAGFITPSAHDLIVPFGYYRVDGSGRMQRPKEVGLAHDGPIFGYCPVLNGGLPEHQFPVVLTDGQRICFSHPHDVEDVIPGWEDLPWDDDAKTIEVAYIDGHLKNFTLALKLLQNGFYGVDALRFADLRRPREFAEEILYNNGDNPPSWMGALGMYYALDGLHFAVQDKKHTYFYHSFHAADEWPSEINGWAIRQKTMHQIFCYRQRGSIVQALAIDLNRGIEHRQEYSAYDFSPEAASAETFGLLQQVENPAGVA